MREILIGRTTEGEKVYVEARIEVSNPGEWQTTEHETVTDPVTLAFSGVVIRPGGNIKRDSDWRGAGQILDDVKRVTAPSIGSWPAEDIAKLVEIWDRWHLNTMRAGCAHQPAEAVYREGKHGREIDLDAMPACPVTGYKYGSAWLTEAVPEDVLKWVRERFELTD